MKKLVVILALLGLIFVYNPQMKDGFVLIDENSDNGVVLIDHATKTITSYKLVPVKISDFPPGYLGVDLSIVSWETYKSNLENTDPTVKSKIVPVERR